MTIDMVAEKEDQFSVSLYIRSVHKVILSFKERLPKRGFLGGKKDWNKRHYGDSKEF